MQFVECTCSSSVFQLKDWTTSLDKDRSLYWGGGEQCPFRRDIKATDMSEYKYIREIFQQTGISRIMNFASFFFQTKYRKLWLQ
jgi:hypothetical protein